MRSLLTTAIVSLIITGTVMADSTIVINLDNDGKQSKSSIELNRQAAGTVNQAASTSTQKAGITTASNAASKNETSIGRVGVVNSDKADIYRATDNAAILYTCQKNAYLAVTSEKGNWYGVLMGDGSTGWIGKKYVSLLDYQVVGKVPQTSAAGTKIVNTALQYLGIQYKWGGYSTNGIDCSGFVKAVYASNGISLPRVARDQANVGKAVSWEELQPGDRLYFSCKGKYIDHTGLYMGNGHFIHSSVGRGGVAIDNINKAFWLKTLVSARRSV